MFVNFQFNALLVQTYLAAGSNVQGAMPGRRQPGRTQKTELLLTTSSVLYLLDL